VDLQTLCQTIQEILFDVPSQPRSLLNDLEICIGGADSVTSGNTSIAEISLTSEMIGLIGRWLGNEERVKTLTCCTPVYDGASQEQLSEQLLRDGVCKPSFQNLILILSIIKTNQKVNFLIGKCVCMSENGHVPLTDQFLLCLICKFSGYKLILLHGATYMVIF